MKQKEELMASTSESKDDVVLIERLALEVPNKYLGLITFNRPAEMNPLDWSLTRKMQKIVEDLAKDKEIFVIAFTGAGKAFSAGGDLKAYLTLQQSEEDFRDFLTDIHDLFDYIETCEKPAVALVNGFCLAGGLELLLACDFGYASESARIGDGHVNFGQMAGGGSLARLPRRIPPGIARELLYTGRLLTAQEALQYSLVNRVVPDGKLIEAALEFANIVAKKSPLAIRNMKRVVGRGFNMTQADAAFLEVQTVHHYCLTSFDSPEGLHAFSEKREPKYEGR